MDTADILDKAADHLERVGVLQDGCYFTYTVSSSDRDMDGPCCSVGAIATVTGLAGVLLGDDEQGPSDWERWNDDVVRAFRVLAEAAGISPVQRAQNPEGHITLWNDRAEAADVVRTFRTAAAAARRKDQKVAA